LPQEPLFRLLTSKEDSPSPDSKPPSEEPHAAGSVALGRVPTSGAGTRTAPPQTPPPPPPQMPPPPQAPQQAQPPPRAGAAAAAAAQSRPVHPVTAQLPAAQASANGEVEQAEEGTLV